MVGMDPIAIVISEENFRGEFLKFFDFLELLLLLLFVGRKVKAKDSFSDMLFLSSHNSDIMHFTELANLDRIRVIIEVCLSEI